MKGSIDGKTSDLKRILAIFEDAQEMVAHADRGDARASRGLDRVQPRLGGGPFYLYPFLSSTPV